MKAPEYGGLGWGILMEFRKDSLNLGEMVKVPFYLASLLHKRLWRMGPNTTVAVHMLSFRELVWLFLSAFHASKNTAATCRCAFSSSLHISCSSCATPCMCVCECVCFLWSPSRCLNATLLIRQAEEKLGVFLLQWLQSLFHSCEQVPKLKDLL